MAKAKVTELSFPEMLLASRFYLELILDGNQGDGDVIFLECQGFKRHQEAIEVAEVTPGQWANAKFGQVRRTKMPGNVKTDNIILRRGMSKSLSLWEWFASVEAGQWGDQLREGSLVVYNQAGKEQVRFNFRGAWPVRYSIADLNAQSSDIEIEELEMAVEQFVRVEPEDTSQN